MIGTDLTTGGRRRGGYATHSYQPQPTLDPDLPVWDNLERLDQRMTALHRRATRQRGKDQARVDSLTRTVGTHDKRLTSLADRLEDTKRELILDGQRHEAIGLGLIGLGLVLQWLGALLAP
ncbi:hypothetical protein EKO23_15210 [Nocardioides guangzhouensis]|uniref:Uncharacterized protein n=1 Tax=Nocardioides guangzhouensis TaxID=2497878 RepID=A0A4Q4Z9L4_9ACTN|nr:hypothetical protein [Nocardioides guangzhouensis]RYP84610.1 hypothetical protein EKO23_15210 [Nocardioides guangzhouensis]